MVDPYGSAIFLPVDFNNDSEVTKKVKEFDSSCSGCPWNSPAQGRKCELILRWPRA